MQLSQLLPLWHRVSPPFLPTATTSLVLILLAGSPVPEVDARGLYVGHGRRSVDDAWSVRLNLSGGLHGASDPWNDQISDSRYPFGTYGTVGLEFNVGSNLELPL